MNPASLAAKYRGAILIDSNVLLLLFIGRFDPDRIETFKGTASRFNRKDFETLRELLLHFRTVVATPHILTEVSNLAGQLGEPLRSAYFNQFKSMLSVIEEEHVPYQAAVAMGCFTRLGLTDAAIVHLVRGRLPVLTVDFDLCNELLAAGVDAVNFNHVRTIGWAES